jgi:hypothetical protein
MITGPDEEAARQWEDYQKRNGPETLQLYDTPMGPVTLPAIDIISLTGAAPGLPIPLTLWATQ